MTRIRFRSDNSHIARYRAEGYTNKDSYGFSAEEWEATPIAEPGDIWRVLWWTPPGEVSPLAGYDICCPKCRQVHGWTSALNCASRRLDGRCDHSGVGSCWTWTGSAEDGTLSASPSLHASGACGYHGFLQHGVLTP